MNFQGFRITNKGRAALIAMKENNQQDEKVPAHYRIADALAEAGLLTPELPEPNDPGIFALNGKGWLPGGSHGPSVWTAPGSLIMVQRIEPGDLTSDEARKLAYALLAAADYAEE